MRAAPFHRRSPSSAGAAPQQDAALGVLSKVARDVLLLVATICCILACAGVMTTLEGDEESRLCLAINHKFGQLRRALQHSNLTHIDLVASLGLVENELSACDLSNPRWGFSGSTWYWW
jgi:hypothetical protein